MVRGFRWGRGRGDGFYECVSTGCVGEERRDKRER